MLLVLSTVGHLDIFFSILFQQDKEVYHVVCTAILVSAKGQ